MIIKDPFTPQKPEFIKIRLSTTFVARCKCKYCGGSPSFYWYTRNPTMWFSPRKEIEHFDFYRKFIKKFNSDFYLNEEPRYFNRMSLFKYVGREGYRPRLHRTRGTNPVFDKVEYLSCDCGSATWAFNQKAGDTRPERSNRRARSFFPQEFID